MHALTALFLSLSAALPVAEERKFDPDVYAKAIAPFVESRTFAVIHLDLTRLDPNALADRFALFTGIDADQKAEVRMVLTQAANLTKAGARDVYLIFSLADIPERKPFLVLPVKVDSAKELAEEVQKVPGYDRRHFGVSEFDGALVLGEDATVKRLRDLKPDARPELAKAFAAAGPGFIHAVAVPTTDLPRIVEELLPKLPPELGGGSIKVLTRGLKAISLAIEAPPKMQFRLIIQATDKDAATALSELLKQAALAVKKEARDAPPELDKLLAALMPKLDGDRLVLTMDEAQFTRTIDQPARRAREAAKRAQSMNNMKQLGLAMHSYLSVHEHFPAPANYDKGDKPLLSWRVHVLPYIEQDALYKEFHLDEPWDSEHNKKLIARMPAIFGSTPDGKLAAAFKTTYLVPRGKETIFPGGKGVRIQDILDGTSNTILMVDAADDKAVIWTKPDDLEIDPKNPHKGLAIRSNDSFICLFADGSVHGLKKTINAKMLWALFTKDGGEVIEIP